MAVFYDRVKDTTTTTGTGDITLSGTAPTGYKAFGDVFAPINDDIYYAITNADESEWEVGIGHLADASTFVRATVHASSNSGAAVSFSAGTKIIFHTLTAAYPAYFEGTIASAIADIYDTLGLEIAAKPSFGQIEAMRLGAAML